jgi:hypothetical protein
MKSCPEVRLAKQLCSRVLLPALLTFTLSLFLACGGVKSQPAATTAHKVLTVTTQTLSSATAESLYSAPLNASGGGPPYTWGISSGSLPVGIAIAPSTSLLSGTPNQAGTSTFKVEVTDSIGSVAYAPLSNLVQVSL